MSPVQQRHTIRSLIDMIAVRFAAAELFYGHGTDNPLDEAVYLIFTVLDLAFDTPESELHGFVDETDLARIEALCQQRMASRKPMAYLLHQAWFCNLPFYVDERVLIPRSPIAELIQQRFQPWLNIENTHSILDIGTGCACIAIACAKALPNASVLATDVQPDALQVAEKNIQRHGLQQRVETRQSDLFSALSACRYDLIISNPPYVSDAEISELPAEYQHEPLSALRADEHGLSLVKQMLRQAPEHLNEDGLLIVEVGYSQQALIEAMPEAPFFWFEFAHGGEGVFMLNRQQLLAMTF